MRKSFWMIPLILLFTVLGSTTAHADTIVTSGRNVTGINGITIAGTTYNVTWGTVIDNTFAASLTNATLMNNAIAADLSASGTTFVADPVSTFIQTVGVAAPSQTTLTANDIRSPGTWIVGFISTSNFQGRVVSDVPPDFAWDQFAVVATPEPGTAPLTLAGLGVIAVLMWKRRQEALRHAQAT